MARVICSMAAFAEQYMDKYVPWVNAPALITLMMLP